MVALLALLGCPGTADYDGDGFVEPEDCNDNNDSAFPGSKEIPYDRVDQDCDGVDITDADGDGWDAEQVPGGKDCNDYRRNVNPSAEEIPYDGIDQNCDGWSDDDFDRDGYLARGHGGDDCDDFDARIVPLDEDGDGFTPCTGDCDETDESRNASAEPVCGNGVEDNCDGIPDCAPAGVVTLEEAPIRIAGGRDGVVDLGWGLALPGDATGDGLDDIAVAGLQHEQAALWLFAGPLAPLAGPADAHATVRLGGDDPSVIAAGEGELVVGFVAGDVAHVGLLQGGLAGELDYADAAELRVQGAQADRVGSALASLDGGDRIAIAARYWGGEEASGAVELLAPSGAGPQVAFGETGALLLGQAGERVGSTIAAVDADGDGVDDLLIDAPGETTFLSAPYAYLVPSPPETGTQAIADLATATFELTGWGGTLGTATVGDVDGDGQDDLVLGAPLFDDAIGAVAIFTTPPTGTVDPEQAPIQRYGLGDDTFGASVAVADFDGDGASDLVIGAPAFWSSGGGVEKPGAVHLWYGPLADGAELSLESDWILEGTQLEGSRSRAGHSVGFSDLDGDQHDDLVVGSPRERSGRVYVFPGGMSALGGI